MNSNTTNRTAVAMIAVCYAILIPSTVALIFLSRGPAMIAVTSAFAIVAASLLLAWAIESAQFLVSQSLALAILALLQVLPEYMFEATLAWNRLIEYAAATMTGSNRLLMGAGWPLVFFITYAFSRRKGTPIKEIRLDARQSVEAFFLVLATLYSFVIVAKRMLDIVDAVVLFSVYVTYLFICMRIPEESEGEVEHVHGPARTIIFMKSPVMKFATITLLIATGGVVIFSSAGPFVLSILGVATILGFSQFLFAQWLAPFLSEFPESASAFYWAGTVRLSPMAIGNMVSSKVNQWTLLLGTIPLVYSLSLGHLALHPSQSSSSPRDSLNGGTVLLRVCRPPEAAVHLEGSHNPVHALVRAIPASSDKDGGDSSISSSDCHLADLLSESDRNIRSVQEKHGRACVPSKTAESHLDFQERAAYIY